MEQQVSFPSEPEALRQLCLNCKHADCKGYDGCKEYRQKRRELTEGGKRHAYRRTWVGPDGRNLTLQEWAEETGIRYETLRIRIKGGLSMVDAIRLGPSKRDNALFERFHGWCVAWTKKHGGMQNGQQTSGDHQTPGDDTDLGGQ